MRVWDAEKDGVGVDHLRSPGNDPPRLVNAGVLNVVWVNARKPNAAANDGPQ